MDEPKISVIIPVFNGEKFIRKAIKSVIDQNYDPLEIIVVDDGSTDGTAEIAKNTHPEILYAYQENAGVAAARNQGLKMATGDYVAFIDADDLWPENKIHDHFEHLHEYPENLISLGSILQFGNDNTQKPERNESVFTLHLGAAVIKKSVFDEIGIMDESMKFAEDIDWFLRAIEIKIPIIPLDKVVYLYRIHQNNMTRNLQEANRFMIKAIKTSLDRRRQANPDNPSPLPNFRNSNALKDFFDNQSTNR